MAANPSSNPFDLKTALRPNKLAGLWALTAGYRGAYLGATAGQAISALAKTGTYLLLREFVDRLLIGQVATQTLLLLALGFIALASVEGSFTFLSGRLAAYTAEGIARRLRNYLFDHIQRLTFTYHDKTADRRADPALHLGCGCPAPLLRRPGDRRRAHHPAVS